MDDTSLPGDGDGNVGAADLVLLQNSAHLQREAWQLSPHTGDSPISADLEILELGFAAS